MTPEGRQFFRSTRPLMGTFVTVTVEHSDAEGAAKLHDLAFESMTDWCAVASEWDETSALSRLSAAAAGEAVPLPERLFELLLLSQRIWRDSEGAFDPSWLPLKALWPMRDQHLPPTEARIAATRADVNFGALTLSADPRPSGRKGHTGLRIGLGAIAKGAAVDLACDALEQAGATAYLVDAGGDIRGQDASSGWTVGLRDGIGRGLHGTIRLKRGAIASSGSYEAGFEHGGRRFHHLLDPRTGWPTAWTGSVSVVAQTCALADALATACFVLGPSAGAPLLERYPMACALWLGSDGRRHHSANWDVDTMSVALPHAFGFC